MLLLLLLLLGEDSDGSKRHLARLLPGKCCRCANAHLPGGSGEDFTSEQINWSNAGFTHKEPPAFCKVWSAAKKFPSLIREFWIVGGGSLFGHTKSNKLILHLLRKIKLHTMHFLPCILNLHFFFNYLLVFGWWLPDNGWHVAGRCTLWHSGPESLVH